MSKIFLCAYNNMHKIYLDSVVEYIHRIIGNI